MAPHTTLTATFASAFTVFALGCHDADPELPKVAQQSAEPQQLAPIAMPATPGPDNPVLLSPSEKAAIEYLRRRGASVTVFRGSGDVLVHFPLGQLERKWRREGLPTAECGVSIEYRFTPDDTGPPMTDADLRYLDELPRLTRVNVAGTQVTATAIQAFRGRHRTIAVEDKDDE